MPRDKFTLTEVLQILENVGIDTECGACMSVAFTGSNTAPHDCALSLVPLEGQVATHYLDTALEDVR